MSAKQHPRHFNRGAVKQFRGPYCQRSSASICRGGPLRAGTPPCHGLLVTGEVLPKMPDGKLFNSSCSAAVVPAEVEISISRAPVNNPIEGTKLASPFTSLCTEISLILRMMGVPGGVAEGSLGGCVKSFSDGRSKVDWKSTGAPRIVFGGVEESVTRTVKG